MNKFLPLVERVIAWNKARYPQQSNYALTTALLDEELTEMLLAKSEIEVLDGFGDIAFVCIGALWKLGCTAEDIANYINAAGSEEYNPIGTFRANAEYCPQLIRSGSLMYTCNPDDAMLVSIICTTFGFVLIPAMWGNGRAVYLAQILDAICTSNETKAVPSELINPAIKANMGVSGKGPNYVAPTKALIKLAAMPRRYM